MNGDDRNKEIIVGITTLVSVAILIFGIIWGKNIRLTANTHQLHILFDISGGVESGDPVTVNGVRSGKVKTVSLSDTGVIITVNIDDDVKIYTDAQSRVENVELMGGKKIEITPGSSGILHDITKPIKGGKIRNIEKTIVLVGDVVVKLDASLNKLNFTLNSLNSLLKDDSLAYSVSNSIKNFEEASIEIRSFIENASKTVKKINSSTEEVTNMAKNFMSSKGSEIETTLTQSQELIKKMDAIAINVDTLIYKLNFEKGTLGKLFSDKTLYESFLEAVIQFDSLMTKIEKRKIKIKVDVDFF